MIAPKIYSMLYKAFISTNSFLISFYEPIEININNKLSKTFYIILSTIFIYFFFSSNNGLKFEQIIFFKWRYLTAYEYILFAFIIFYISHNKIKNSIHALDYTIQSVYSCGLIYELPSLLFYEPFSNLFTKYWSLFQIQSIIFLIYKLHILNLKIDKKLIIIFSFWLFFSIISYFNIYLFYSHNPISKLIRIPTMILLITLIYNVKPVYN